jgi:hypothetical protein
MITFIAYREARFKNISATEAAIEQALACEWSVSDVWQVRPGQFVVRFRYDQDCSSGAAGPTRPELPSFNIETKTAHLGVGMAGAFAHRLRMAVHSAVRHGGRRAMRAS